MPHYRSEEEQVKYFDFYASHPKDDVCQFCIINDGDQLVSMHTYFKILVNIFPYSIWDGRHVSDHLMLIPKAHTDTLSSLPGEAKLEFTELVGMYDLQGYDIFARSPHSSIKSMPHHHTHLLKTEGPAVKGLSYTEKPYKRTIIE